MMIFYGCTKESLAKTQRSQSILKWGEIRINHNGYNVESQGAQNVLSGFVMSLMFIVVKVPDALTFCYAKEVGGASSIVL